MAPVSDILTKQGVPNAFLIDDLATVGSTREECQRNLDTAIDLFRRLGLRLNPAKVVPPSQVMEFLDISIDTVNQRLSIAPEKLEHYGRRVAEALADDDAGALPVRQLESLLGKLNWYCEVLIAGRARLSRIRACVPGGGATTAPRSTRRSVSPRKPRTTSAGGKSSYGSLQPSPALFPSGRLNPPSSAISFRMLQGM